MSNTDSHQHVVKTSAQWNERAIEYWIVPRGCLCVELTPKGKTKLKVGEGNKNYYQLPYIYDFDVLLNYYTKEQVDALFNNYNRMAIMSTNEYNSATDLPRYGNKFGDVRFVKSKSPSIKTDPDLYVWNGHKWIFIGTPFNEITDYVNREEFNQLKARVEVVEQKAHTHDNKEILDSITQADREKFDSLHNYDDTEIRELIAETGHTHPNKPVLDEITQADLDKLDSLHNYDDTELRRKISNQKTQIDELEAVKHSHDNKSTLDRITDEMLDELDTFAQCCFEVKQDIAELKENEHSHRNLDLLNETTASYTLEDQKILYDLYHIGAFLGAGPTWDGTLGYVPAPEMGQQTYFLRADGTWAKVKSGGDKYKAGEGITILSGEVISDTFPFEIFPKADRVTQYVIYGTHNGVGNYVQGHYDIPIKVSAPGYSDRVQTISVADPLYDGDYIDYQRQIFSHYRTDVTAGYTTDSNNYGYEWAIYSDGHIGKLSPGAFGGSPTVTVAVPLDPGAKYELTPWNGDGRFMAGMYLNLYDANMNRTRTIFQEYEGNTVIIPNAGEVYMRLTIQSTSSLLSSDRHMYRLLSVETPCTLRELTLYPNVINTVDVLTTNKPNEIYVEVEPAEDEPVDPDDPMSEYTGIIYNDGVLDVTQEDPNALNELTFHYRDNATKTLTIPGGGGGDETYEAGNGIEFTRASTLPSGYTQLSYVASGDTTSYIDTGVSHGFTAHIDLQYEESNHRQLMGVGLSSGMYFGSNASEEFEMYYAIAGTDTTQRNSIIWYHDEINPARLEVAGESITDTDPGTSSNTFKIFSPFASDGYGSSVKIYSVDIYDNNNTLIRKFIPCQSPSNVVGMYDSVNDVFYSPTGAPLSAGLPLGNVTINAKLGNGLRFDSNGAIETTGSGSGGQYEAGVGINIISDSGSTVSRSLKVNAQTAQANDYTIYGASGGVGQPSINLMPALTMSSIWADTWYADGTHEGKPAFSKNTWYGGITNEVYLTEGTYTFSLDVKLSSTSVQGILANELNDQSRYPHYNQAATVDIMHYGPFYPVDTDWHRYSYTFEVTSAGYVACRAENVSSSNATISVARAQLERGSVAHDYVEHDCYTIPITVSAPNETDIEIFIEISAPLGNGDSINFIDDALPTLALYQNKINTITVNTTVVPSRFTVDASAGSDVTSVIELDDSITIRFNCNNDPDEY